MSLFSSSSSDLNIFAQNSLAYPGALKRNALNPGEKAEEVSGLPTDQFQTVLNLGTDGQDAVASGPLATISQSEARPAEGTAQPVTTSLGATGGILMEQPNQTSEPQASSTPWVASYGKAETLAQVTEKAAQLPQIARSMIINDIGGVFKDTPQRMADRYHIDLADNPKLAKTLANSHAFAYKALDELSTKILKHTQGGEFHNLDVGRMSLDRVGDAVSQHVAYAAGEVSRAPEIKDQPGREISRVVLRNYFLGTGKNTGGGDNDPRALMISELGNAAGGSPEAKQAIADFVAHPDKAGLFSREKMATPQALLPNLASFYAGDAVLQFASKLTDGDDRRAEALVKYVFTRPVEELNQMLTDPQGMAGLLVNFAAVAHHQAWQWAKLGGAGVAAKAGDESAIKAWNHAKVGSTLDAVAEDESAALKVAEQVEAFLLRDGKLVPCERGKATGQAALQTMLQDIETHGIYSGKDLRVLSQTAVNVKERLWSEVAKIAKLDDWAAGNELAGDLVAHTCASFAAQAVNADFQEKENLVSLYRDAIGRFAPQVEKLYENGKPDKGDERYQAFFQELAGEFGFEALKTHMGTGAAHDLVRNASLAHIIPIACDSLRLDQQKDYTPTQMVADMEELQKTLLKDDYFLTQPGFLDELKSEAARPTVDVDRKALENGIRVPNAVWMWTQLTRGKVENKAGRHTGGEADLKSDKFPSAVQFSPPDVRDVELFSWAQHRLSKHGYEPKDATRMALSLVVLTLHKDLLQMRKAS